MYSPTRRNSKFCAKRLHLYLFKCPCHFLQFPSQLFPSLPTVKKKKNLSLYIFSHTVCSREECAVIQIMPQSIIRHNWQKRA